MTSLHPCQANANLKNAATLSTQVSNPKDINQAVNRNYVQLKQAFENLDKSYIDTLYHTDAVYISETQDRPIVYGNAAIGELYSIFFKKISRKQARLEVDFRVLNRQFGSDQITDVGYYLVRFHPSPSTGEPVSIFSGKFVTMHKLDMNKQWKISVDSNTRAKPDFYFEATPVANLYFGKQFIDYKDTNE